LTSRRRCHDGRNLTPSLNGRASVDELNEIQPGS
jgi:hypothetical protein